MYDSKITFLHSLFSALFIKSSYHKLKRKKTISILAIKLKQLIKCLKTDIYKIYAVKLLL